MAGHRIMTGGKALVAISRRLCKAVDELTFVPPVAHVYNPLAYARRPHERYLARFGDGKKDIVLVGMNPGPWGMAQTGVPFGHVGLVRDWLGIEEEVERPSAEHPKRPIEGFACQRSEVSGARLWGWAKQRYGDPEAFFARFFVVNYCPLVFMEASSKNRTPDKLPKAERVPLLAACDRALLDTVTCLQPQWVIGVGAYAAKRAQEALDAAGGRRRADVKVGAILHPSPASPRANRGWAAQAEEDLSALGIAL